MPEALAGAPDEGFGRVAIVGCGLIGGSVAAALRARGLCELLTAYSPADGAQARALGLVDVLAPTLEAAIDGADLVVLAAPVSVNAGLMPAIAGALGDRSVLTDVSSVKAGVVAAARAGLGPKRRRFVASHPIAGGETSGPSAANPALFEGRSAILSPMADADPDAVDEVRRLWQALGASTLDLDVDEHDRVYALVSHWPHAVAFGLARAVAGALGAAAPGAAAPAVPAATAARADALIGAGLRDTTRIAASDPGLWADILLQNAGPVLDAARAFGDEIERLERAIRLADRDALVALIGDAARWRREIGR
ncbi:MAG: prephenate dehydrogenase [Lautropia sp.]